MTNTRPESRRQFLQSCAAFSVAASAPGLVLGERRPQQPQAIQPEGPSVVATPVAIPHTAGTVDFTEIDSLVRGFMEHSGVGAGQLAIVRDGVLQLSRPYSTKPLRGYAVVDRQSLFRVASLSKMFTCAAIGVLQSSGKLTMDAKVFPLLGVNAPGNPKDRPDPRIDDISIQHLVDHAGGWNDHESVRAKDGTQIPGTNWDPTFKVREIAYELHLSTPPTKLDLARYAYGKPLQFTPGTQNFNSTNQKSYSNLGYVLLGLVIEQLTGQSYIDFVRSGLGSGDTSSVFVSKTASSARAAREVWYQDPGLGLTAFEPRSSVQLPAPYGGGFLTELVDSAGGLMTNAETLALFSSRHAVWGIGGRAAGSERSGSLPGTTSRTYSRRNGVDCAFVLNTRTFNGGPKTEEDFVSSLRQLLDKL